MGYRIGDAVRLRPGSDMHELLEPWGDATARVTGVDEGEDSPRVNVLYGEEGPMAFGILASEFETDPVGFDGPF